MFALVSWLLGNAGVPAHALVWASGGFGIAVAVTVLLLASVVVFIAERERPTRTLSRRIRPQDPSITTESSKRLPSAA